MFHVITFVVCVFLASHVFLERCWHSIRTSILINNIRWKGSNAVMYNVIYNAAVGESTTLPHVRGLFTIHYCCLLLTLRSVGKGYSLIIFHDTFCLVPHTVFIHEPFLKHPVSVPYDVITVKPYYTTGLYVDIADIDKQSRDPHEKWFSIIVCITWHKRFIFLTVNVFLWNAYFTTRECGALLRNCTVSAYYVLRKMYKSRKGYRMVSRKTL